MKEIGKHLTWDLFIEADKKMDSTRFFVPVEGNYQPISWKKYSEEVKKIAGYLLSEGIQTQEKVSLLGHNTYNWCVTHLGIQSTRGIMVPIYPASQANLLEYFFEHSDSRFLFCDSAFLPMIQTINRAKIEKIIVLDDKTEGYDLPLVKFSDALKQGEANLAKAEEIIDTAQSDDIACIIYTSGTTGLPKGVMLTHKNLQSSSEDWIALNGSSIPENAVDPHWLPLSHTFGSGSIMLGNRLGWQTYFVSHKDVLAKMTDIKPHLFLSVPAYWEKVYNMMQSLGGDDMKANFDKVTGGRLVFGLSGGAGLKKEIKEGFHKIGFLIIEGYGLTECSPTLTMNRKDKFNFDTVGVPYPSVQVKLAEDGEILAKGPNIFKGYYKDEKATNDAFDEEGWFKTGDVGLWTDDGFLKIIDRKKEILVTSGGKNIPPQNIERMYQDNIYINHFVAYGDGKKYLSGLVTLNEEPVRAKLGDNETPWEELVKSQKLIDLVNEQVEAANEKLASFETIKKVFIYSGQLTVEENLLTSSLKIRRKAIYERFRNELEALH